MRKLAMPISDDQSSQKKAHLIKSELDRLILLSRTTPGLFSKKKDYIQSRSSQSPETTRLQLSSNSSIPGMKSLRGPFPHLSFPSEARKNLPANTEVTRVTKEDSLPDSSPPVDPRPPAQDSIIIIIIHNS